MGLIYEERFSDSAFVERIWRTQSEASFDFTSMAMSQWFMALWTQEGRTHIAVHGPKMYAFNAPVPEYADFIGIVFKHSTLMPHLLANQLVNDETELPEGAFNSFWLNGRVWKFPTYDNADIFINRLVKEATLIREPVIDAALKGYSSNLSQRSIQRRLVNSTGLTQNAIFQIERAREAAILLQRGNSILDTVYQLGYADQPHLTRSLRRFIGLTPAQLSAESKSHPLSFLFKTEYAQSAMLPLAPIHLQGAAHAEDRFGYDYHAQWPAR